MESAAIAAVDNVSRYGRRVFQMIFDPEPENDTELNMPVWCLGASYTRTSQSKLVNHPADSPKSDAFDAPSQVSTAPEKSPSPRPVPPTTASTTQSASSQPVTPPDSISSSLDSSLAYDEPAQDRDRGWPSAFLDDFESRMWMTYRSDFEPIPRSTEAKALSSLSLAMRLKAQMGDQHGFASDSGWGCMIRSGQCLLANTMAILRLGRGWRRTPGNMEERSILSLFADDPRAPYSIHNFVRHGAAACGKYPGEWFGPSATARCIQALANEHEPILRVYSTGDLPDVYEDSFMQTAKPAGQVFHPTLILVGTRLGIDKVNPVYYESLVAALQMPQSIGIAGGRPKSSHYFVGSQGAGAQGSYLFYLDPHLTRPALPFHETIENYVEEDIESCHTRRLRRLHVREMDPSMLIGFLIRNEEDWGEWKRAVRYVQGKAIVNISDTDPARGMAERGGAIDEVETISDDDGDTILGA